MPRIGFFRALIVSTAAAGADSIEPISAKFKARARYVATGTCARPADQ
jgi:hypothetical protein